MTACPRQRDIAFQIYNKVTCLVCSVIRIPATSNGIVMYFGMYENIKSCFTRQIYSVLYITNLSTNGHIVVSDSLKIVTSKVEGLSERARSVTFLHGQSKGTKLVEMRADSYIFRDRMHQPTFDGGALFNYLAVR